MNYWGLRTAIRIRQIHKKSEMILSDMKIYKRKIGKYIIFTIEMILKKFSKLPYKLKNQTPMWI